MPHVPSLTLRLGTSSESIKGSPLEPALTDLLVLVPWTYAGVIVIDGYHVPYYKRRLGLL